MTVTTTPHGSPVDAVTWAADAVAHLVSLEEGAMASALDSLQRLVDVASSEVALIVVSQLCAGVALGCADLLDIEPVRLVRDTAASILAGEHP